MQLTTECWKPIVDFEGLYEVSNLGNVKTIASNTRYRPNQSGIKLKQLSRYGYYTVGLFKDNKPFYKRVCRLVAMAFIENPNCKPCVNHINGVKHDDNVNNLEWVTYSENEQHSYNVLGKNLKGIKKTFKNGVNPKRKKVMCIEKNIIFDSVKDAANSLGLYRANIASQINGKIKKTGGFSFKFI
mgnify:CR=1 FL=1